MRFRLMAATALVPLLAACGGGSSGDGSTVDNSGAAGGGSGVAASCVAPTLTVKPVTVQAGDKVQVTGEWFADGCNDVAIDGQPPQPPPPFMNMTIELRQGDQTWPVASDVDATGDHYAFDLSVTIPDDVHPGKATLQAKDRGFPTDLEVVSAYVDQRPEGDLSRGRAEEFGFKVYPSVAEALRCGGDKLAVDAVLQIGEHGEYHQTIGH